MPFFLCRPESQLTVYQLQDTFYQLQDTFYQLQDTFYQRLDAFLSVTVRKGEK